MFAEGIDVDVLFVLISQVEQKITLSDAMLNERILVSCKMRPFSPIQVLTRPDSA